MHLYRGPTAVDSVSPVAVVCAALDVEYLAVREHLTGHLARQEERGSQYEIGTLADADGAWTIGLALTGRDNSPAGIQIERAISVFRPEVVLFVGVAGGRRDSRLGDVIAASAVYDYESGMDTDNGYKTRIKTMPSSVRLVQHAHATVRAACWQRRIKPEPPEMSPSAVVRPVAAGGKVVVGSCSPTALLIEQQCGDAQGVDMEDYGVLQGAYANADVDALAIRGVSDLLDGKTKAADRRWQPTAAKHAAAFAIELLATLTSRTRTATTPDKGCCSSTIPGAVIATNTGPVWQSGDGHCGANTGIVWGDFTAGGPAS